MRRLLLPLAALVALTLAGTAHARTSLVEVPLSGPLSVGTLERLGLDVTHDVDEDSARVVLYSDAERERLADAGFPAREVFPDLDAAHRSFRAQDAALDARQVSRLPSGRDTYRSLTNYYGELDALAQAHPGLVRRVDLPGRTVEGRAMPGVEIAGGVNRSDDGRPVYVVMGLHHAREWPSAEVNLEFALDLARNYGRDPRITSLLDRVRVYVFPVINPDGFVVSRGDDAAVPPIPPTKPLQRKNCQFDASGPSEPCSERESVDLNRNYGAFWGGNGASTSPSSDTYRGPGPWSEPESRAVWDFSKRLHITNFQSIHNIAALVLRPPGFRAFGLAPDEARLKELGDRMGQATGYKSEFGYELYEVTGATEDWNYVAQNAFGYTIELGGPPGTVTFQGPYQTHVVEQYLGADGGPEGENGVREALLLAGEQAGDPRDHSVLTGEGVPGATLRLTKRFDTTTSPICQPPYGGGDSECPTRGAAFTIPDGLDTQLTVPASGRFEWHVTPSTRPFERKANRVEAWTLTCTTADGRLLATREVVVGIGERLALRACTPPAANGTPQAGAPRRRNDYGFVVPRRQRRATVLRRGIFARVTCPVRCTVRTRLQRPGSRRPRAAQRPRTLGARRFAVARPGKARRVRIRLSRAARRAVRTRRVRRINVRFDARSPAGRRLEARAVVIVR